MPDKYLEELEELVREGWFPNRSAAIRTAVYLLLRQYGRQARRPWELRCPNCGHPLRKANHASVLMCDNCGAAFRLKRTRRPE